MASKKTVTKRFIRPLGLQDFLILAAVLSLCVVQLKAFASDPGLGWHLLAGKYILDHGSLPQGDFLTAASQGNFWMLDQWLADLFLASFYSFGGWPLLYTSFILIYLATHFLILYPFLLRFGGMACLSCVLTLFSFKFGQVHFILRPVMLSFLFFAIVYTRAWNIYGVSKEGSGVRWKKEAMLVYLALLLWANIHPTFVLGLAFLSLLFPALIIERWRSEESQTVKDYLPLLFFVFGAYCITFINPYGVTLHQYILWLGRNDFVTTFYSEWQSPNFRNDEGLYTILPLFLMAGSMYLWPKGRRLDALSLISVGLFFLLTVKAVRMLPFWGIVVSVPLLKALTSAFQQELFQQPPFRIIAKSLARIELREQRSYKGALAGTICVLCILFSCFQQKVFLYQGPLGPSPERFPYGVLEPLSSLTIEKRPLIIANYMAWGSFLNFYLEGKVLPLIDDRSSVHGEQFYKDYFDALKPGGNYKEYLEELKVDYVLLPLDHSLGRVWDRYSVYQSVYRDKQAVLYAVKSGG